MKLAVFDLDHTLIDIDSDYNWGQYITDKGLCDYDYHVKNRHYFDQYLEGSLDPVEYCEFVAGFLAGHSMDDIYQWRSDYIATIVQPSIRPLGVAAINHHKSEGHEIVISSATNDFIVSGVAELFGISCSHVIASRLEKNDSGYTGKCGGLPNFTSGKVTNLNVWLADKPPLQESWAYSDSFNDVPLLEMVDHAFAISADERLQQHAKKCNWHCIDWSLKV